MAVATCRGHVFGPRSEIGVPRFKLRNIFSVNLSWIYLAKWKTSLFWNKYARGGFITVSLVERLEKFGVDGNVRG